jgi:hypothetical protein
MPAPQVLEKHQKSEKNVEHQALLDENLIDYKQKGPKRRINTINEVT